MQVANAKKMKSGNRRVLAHAGKGHQTGLQILLRQDQEGSERLSAGIFFLPAGGGGRLRKPRRCAIIFTGSFVPVTLFAIHF